MALINMVAAHWVHGASIGVEGWPPPGARRARAGLCYLEGLGQGLEGQGSASRGPGCGSAERLWQAPPGLSDARLGAPSNANTKNRVHCPGDLGAKIQRKQLRCVPTNSRLVKWPETRPLPQSALACVLATESVMRKKETPFPEAMEKYLGINLMRNACDLYKDNYKILLVK